MKASPDYARLWMSQLTGGFGNVTAQYVKTFARQTITVIIRIR